MGKHHPFFFFSETKVKCVQKSYHSFSDNDINYKPSMKNVQSFHVIRFKNNNNNCAKGAFYPTCGAKRPHGWGKMPPSLTKQFALNIYSKIRVQVVLA